MNRDKGSLLVGAIIIIVGAMFLLNSFGFHIRMDFWNLWPLIFIIPSVYSIAQSGFRLGNGLLFVFGVYFLLNEYNWLPDISGTVLWGGVLIFVGIMVMFPGRRRRYYGHYHHHTTTATAPPPEYEQASETNGENADRRDYSGYSTNAEDNPSVDAIFSGREAKIVSQHLTHGSFSGIFGGVEVDINESRLVNNAELNVSGIFGGADLDLRNTVLPEHITINVNGIFGGATVRVPQYVKVISHGVPVLGGFDCDVWDKPVNEHAPVITIHYLAAFGGVEITTKADS